MDYSIYSDNLPHSVVVQSLSHVWLFVTPWTACSRPSFPVLHYLLEFAQIHVHWVTDAVWPSHLLLPLSPLLLSVFPSISVFCNESALHNRWPKYLSHLIEGKNFLLWEWCIFWSYLKIFLAFVAIINVILFCYILVYNGTLYLLYIF